MTNNIYKTIFSSRALPFGKGLGWAFFFFSWIGLAQDVSQNWVKQKVYKVATEATIAAPTAAEANISVTYMDGFGRPVMKIANKQSNSGKDIVVPIAYDGFGRTTKNYMPYVAATATMDYVDYTTQDINALIAPSYPQYEGQNFYSEMLYEASPLNRIRKQAAPGDASSWAMGSGHEVKYAYQTNTADDAVKKYTVSSSGQLVDDGFFAPNTLYKNILYNENSEAEPTRDDDHATISYTNLRGQVVLQRTYNSSVVGATATFMAHDTYSVYDGLDNLTFVLPPTITNIITQLATLAYHYKYDNYNRLIEKKTPDKTNWENIVYDKLNRIIGTGPVASPFVDGVVGYMLSRYDNLNRVVYTGWYATALSRAEIQADYTGAIANVTKTASNNSIDGKNVRYTTDNLPTGFKLLTVNYYDDYDFPDAPTDFASTTALPVHYNLTNKPKGLPTGSWVRVLYGSIPIGETSKILYDYRARPIKTNKTNYKGGYTQTSTELDFTGKTLVARSSHIRQTIGIGTIVPVLIQTTDAFSYSAQDRLTQHTKQINSEAVQVLTEPAYDELGQLLYKNVGGIANQPRLQKVDYTYNLRGWLTSINQVKHLSNTQPLNIDSEPNDLFGFRIGYTDTAHETNLYNGNIAHIQWRSANDNILRQYDFAYDQGNRLLTAVYSKPHASDPDTDAYNESASYDAIGNIMTLNRNGGQDLGTPNEIDDLVYRYKPNTNQLGMVYDGSNSPQGFKDNANATAIDLDDYTYDTNGNLKTDNNKGITDIKYNHLNLPVEIIFTTTKKIVYLYDAAGSKVQKTVTNGLQVITTDYLDGYQYNQGVLQFFGTSEGYVVDTQTKTATGTKKDNYNYVYNYLDHLGNVRMSYSLDKATQVLKIIEENGYYPYGLKHENYNTILNRYKAVLNETKVALKETPSGGQVANDNINQYKFNGQEWQNELGLNITAMDYRQYDNALGRFNCIDPVTHFSQTPYQFGNGNPMYWADPSGLDGVVYGMAGQEAPSNPNPRGHDTFGNTNGMMPGNPYAHSVGAAWGDGGKLAGYYDGQTFYGAEAVNMLRGYSSVWHEGSVTTYSANAGDPSLNGETLYNVNLGYWEKVSTNIGVGLMYSGTYLDMLDDYAKSNAGNVFKYGTKEFSAAQLTLQNASRMTQISKVATVSGRALGGAGVLLSGFSIYSKYANNQTITTSEIVGATVGLSFLAGGIIAAGTAAAPFIGAAAIIYGSIQIISYTTTGKTVEQHIFND